MICIGAEGTDRFIHKLSEKYADAGLRTEICFDISPKAAELINEAESRGCEVFIMPPVTSGAVKYDILILVSETDIKNIPYMANVKSGGYVIVNSDDCGLNACVIPNGVNIVTCGVNSRSAVTFSGIAENRNGRETIQCCIQKYIKTVSGRKIVPQEFAVNVLGKYPISEVLAIIAAAVTGDIEQTVTTGRLFSSD